MKIVSLLTALMAGSACGAEETAPARQSTEPPLLSSEGPTWLQDYTAASKKGKRETKPLVVVIGSGDRGWNQVSEEGKLGEEANQLLAARYVCVYVNLDKPSGRKLASAFEISDGPGIVISDPSGEVQAFRHEGELSTEQLAHYVRKFADADQTAERTETPSAAQVSSQGTYNFALKDLGGRRWELRRHRSRLTLVDFWGTWCPHCIHAIPHLNVLHERYHAYGLQVVGIAYEEGSVPEQVKKVNEVRRFKGMKYPVLLGNDRATCPVRTQFQVRTWPTLALLDDKGRVIYRTEGLDAERLRELESVIQQELEAR